MNKYGSLKKVALKSPIDFEIQIVTEKVYKEFESKMIHLGFEFELAVVPKTKEKFERFFLRISVLPNIISKRSKSEEEIVSLVNDLIINQLKV